MQHMIRSQFQKILHVLVQSHLCYLCTIHIKDCDLHMYMNLVCQYVSFSPCCKHGIGICFVHITASSWIYVLYFGLMCKLSITKLMACIGLSMLCNESRCSTQAGRILPGLWGVPRIGRVELNILEAFSFACRICWFSCS